MKSITTCMGIFVAIYLIILSDATLSYGQLEKGRSAPLFDLKSSQGQIYDLAQMKDQPMLILYFFDVASQSSVEGLLSLDKLAKKYKDADLTVWGITRATSSQVAGFLSKSQLSFPILIDERKISDLYAARTILPTVCIVGPDLKLLDYIQGGGQTTDTILVTLAERKLQHRQPHIAKALSDEVISKNPNNARAKSVQGYAALKEGNLDSAEKTFYALSRKKGQSELIGKEGLSQVYARKGQPEKAMNMARELENKASGRAYAHIVKGDLLYRRNKAKEAEAEYRKAIRKTHSDPAHRAVAYNQLGRIYAIRGDYKQSLGMYDKAVELDPYYVEATSNKGMMFERQGEWDKALEVYRKAKSIDSADPFAATLAANAKKMMLLQKDPDSRQQMAAEIDRYVQRYKQNGEITDTKSQDPWTSRQTVLVLYEPIETGGLSFRDGFSHVMALYLADQLNASGRVKVIDPVILEKVMRKLGLTSDDVLNMNTLVQLAEACGAQILGKGTLFHLSEGTLLKYQLIDTISQHEAQRIQRQFASAVTLQKDFHWLNRETLRAIMTQYPLQSFVVEVRGHQVLMNLGLNQGVVVGSQFDVVEEKPEITYKGKKIKPDAAVMATVEVVRVEDEFAYAHIKDQRRPVVAEDKLRESIRQLGNVESFTW